MVSSARRDTRRRLVLAALGGSAAWYWAIRRAVAAGAKPYLEGVHEFDGDVRVNGQAVTRGFLVKPGDTVTTGAGARVIIVMAQDVFLIRADSQVSFEAADKSAAWGVNPAQVLRVITGAILSVFGPGNKRLYTPTATIGVRGTGLYIEARPGESYVCTCYGTVEMGPSHDPAVRETVSTRHHEAPRLILGAGAGQAIRKAPVVNHTDAELYLLESLVGRKPPFKLGEDYGPLSSQVLR